MLNIKYFILGAILTSFPTSAYLFSQTASPKVLSTQVTSTQNASPTDKPIVSSTPSPTSALTATPTPEMTATPTPTILKPTVTPVPTTTPTIIPTTISTATATPATIPTYLPSFNATELVNKYAGIYTIDPAILFRIGQCESKFNTNSVNGPYAGIYQFHYNTWQSVRTRMNENPDPSLRTNPEESIKTAAFKISKDGTGAWANCD